jgi:hypothetical protein
MKDPEGVVFEYPVEDEEAAGAAAKVIHEPYRSPHHHRQSDSVARHCTALANDQFSLQSRVVEIISCTRIVIDRAWLVALALSSTRNLLLRLWRWRVHCRRLT